MSACALPARQATIDERGPQDVTAEARSGWIYQGNFDAGSVTWKTRYLDFPDGARPAEFVGKTYAVRESTGALNVRKSAPDTFGNFGVVVDVLQVGSKVEIERISEWYSTGYIGARARYGSSE